MALHAIQTTNRPFETITVDEAEYEELLTLGLVYSGTPAAPVADAYDLLFADKVQNGTATPAALRAALVLPKIGSYTYNSDGTVASGPDGETYAYNSDGTVHSVTLNGVTRVFSYNSDGTVAAAA